MRNRSFHGVRLSALAGLVLALVPMQPVLAQDAHFSNADGSIKIVGTVKAFDGETYVIESLFGTLDISSDAVSCEGAGCPVREVRRSWSEGEIGARVSLASADGALDISGQLVTFDGEVIEVRNSIGVLALPFREMRCTGAGCPAAVEEVTYIIPGS